MIFSQEQITNMAKLSGMNASVGKTDRDGKYTPFINALGKDVPYEWLEAFAVRVNIEVVKKLNG